MPVLDGASGAVSKELHREADDMATDSDSDSEWELSRTSLNKALADNRSLQAKILSELETIAKKKRDNRLEAEKCIAESCAILLPPQSKQPPDPTDENPKPKGKLKRPRQPKGHPQYTPTNKDIHALIAFDNSEDGDDTSKPDEQSDGKKVWTTHLRKKFRFDPFRKWTEEYFTDPTGSHPRDNEDSVRRRNLMMKAPSTNGSEQNDKQEMIPDTFFYHTAQPFTPKEKALLDKYLFQDGNNNANHINKRDDASNTFYQDIAQKLRQEHHEDAAERWKDKAIFSTCLPRSADDIRMYHRHCLVSQYEFTKEESLAILEGVEEAATKSAQQASDSNSEESSPNANMEESDGPDWRNICDRVLEVHKRRQNISEETSDDFFPITPYRCMVHYKRKLRAQPDGSFTPEEDELLLRYIAAMGPQFVWGYPQITDLASRLFPKKSSRRLYERTLFSQWHPLVKDKPWTKDEEMKLVLAMKIYNGNNNNETEAEALTQKQEKARLALEKAALRKTSAHFHPYRQSYKIGKKWDRTFSPRFNYKPFSPQDDAKLLAAVRSSSVETPFSEIAKKHFPDRSSDQLYQRWSKIAPEKEVIEKYVPTLMRSGLKRGLLSTKKGTPMEREVANAESSNDPNGTETLFDPSDFVVEVLGDETKSDQN